MRVDDYRSGMPNRLVQRWSDLGVGLPRRHSPALSTTTRLAATVSLRASRPESVPACLAGSATLDLPSPRQTMPAPTAAPTLPARTRTDRVHRPAAGPAALDQVRAAARLAD